MPEGDEGGVDVVLEGNAVSDQVEAPAGLLPIGAHPRAGRLGGHGQPIRAAIESMNGARFVHEQLQLAGWEVEVADAVRVKGLAPLACKTGKAMPGSSPSSVGAIWRPRSGCAPPGDAGCHGRAASGSPPRPYRPLGGHQR